MIPALGLFGDVLNPLTSSKTPFGRNRREYAMNVDNTSITKKIRIANNNPTITENKINNIVVSD
jgi:hypothetical protein